MVKQTKDHPKIKVNIISTDQNIYIYRRESSKRETLHAETNGEDVKKSLPKLQITAATERRERKKEEREKLGDALLLDLAVQAKADPKPFTPQPAVEREDHWRHQLCAFTR